MELYLVILIALAFFITTYRLFKGPTVLDRLMAYSSLSAKIIVFLMIENILNRKTVYMNLAFIYAVLSFLGVVVVARFIERKEEF